jgi:hypothetical protein
MTQHMGKHARHADSGRIGQLLQPARRGVPVHPAAVQVTQDWSLFPAFGGVLDRAGYRGR